jgi:hypothetical protein
MLRVSRVVASVLVTVGLAACGSSDDSNKRAGAVEVAARMRTAVMQKAMTSYTECQTDLGDLVDRLHDLDGRVAAGLSFSEYVSALGDARDSYDGVPLRRIKNPRCLGGVGLPAENAFNEHVAAANAWHRCLNGIHCTEASIKPALERRWAKAARLTVGARRNLELMRRP